RAAGVDQGVPPRGPGISGPGHSHRPRRQVRDLLRPGALEGARRLFLRVLPARGDHPGASGRRAVRRGVQRRRSGPPLGGDGRGASARRAELLGEKTARPTSSRFSPFVYRADSGWVYSLRSLELRANGAEMRDPIMERGGTGEEYPTILVAAQRATYDTARAKRGWTLTKGAVRYLLGPGREPTFKFDSLRVTTLRETPTALLAEPKAPDEMRYAELGRYVDA